MRTYNSKLETICNTSLLISLNGDYNRVLLMPMHWQFLMPDNLEREFSFLLLICNQTVTVCCNMNMSGCWTCIGGAHCRPGPALSCEHPEQYIGGMAFLWCFFFFVSTALAVRLDTSPDLGQIQWYNKSTTLWQLGERNLTQGPGTTPKCREIRAQS